MVPTCLLRIKISPVLIRTSQRMKKLRRYDLGGSKLETLYFITFLFFFQVKTAKKIAKDMEKWAKTLNQKKEAAKASMQREPNSVNQSTSNPSTSSGAEDIVFSMLQKKPAAPHPAFQDKSSNNSLSGLAGYGSDDEDGDSSSPMDESKHTDWEKKACLLCKRQFASKEKLEK